MKFGEAEAKLYRGLDERRKVGYATGHYRAAPPAMQAIDPRAAETTTCAECNLEHLRSMLGHAVYGYEHGLREHAAWTAAINPEATITEHWLHQAKRRNDNLYMTRRDLDDTHARFVRAARSHAEHAQA